MKTHPQSRELRGTTSRTRPRPTPRWLLDGNELDDIARRRSLLVLSVLSGEKPVTEAIAESGISRGMYYQLETRALEAMIRALAPGVDSEGAPAVTTSARISELEEKVKTLEQGKRRADRLLFLTRKVIKPGSVKTKAGRPSTARRSKATGARASSSTAPRTAPMSSPPSSPAPTGGGAP